jgi:predicted Zn-ribbon and HTH transcriptional regulator
MRERIKLLLNEQSSNLTQREIESIVEEKLKKVLLKQLKNDKDIEEYLMDMNRNTLVQLFKTLWVKRGTWKNDIRNQKA